MNKLFTKVAALTLGVAMAAGVGVALGSAKASEAKAASGASVTGYTQCTSVDDIANHTSGKFLIAGVTGSDTFFLTNGQTSAGRINGVPSASLVTADSEFEIAYDSTSVSGKEGYTIKGASRYYGYGTSGTNIAVSTSVSSANFLWTISVVDGRFRVVNTGTAAASTVRCLVYRAGTSNQFAAYSQANIDNSEYFDVEFYYASSTPVPVTQYNVTDSVENGSVSPSKVNEGATLTATITPDTGYTLPETVTVTIGGTAATNTYENGVVTVQNVTGDVVISGTCPEKQAPQPVDLPDGEYTASFPYANPFPTEIDVVDGQSAKVAALTSSISTVSTYDDSHSEYVIAANQSIEINNLTNGKISKVDIHIYQYKNFNVYVDDATDPVYTGDGTNAGNDAHIEVTTNALSKVKITGNGGDNGTRTFKVYDVKVYIVVASAPIAVEGVSLNAEEATMAVGATYSLTATVTPTGADNPAVTWSSNPTSVATVSDDGVVTAVAAGDAVVTVTTVDGGFTDTFTAHVVEVNYGSESNPLTVEEARAALDVSGAATSLQKLWVYGEVYSSSYNSQYQDYTLWLKSSDGSENEYFEIYSGSISTAITEDDTQTNALAGITVICNGYGKIHNSSVYELFRTNDEKPTIAKYEAPAPTLESIAVSGKYKTKYGYQAEEFDKEGIVVTATYSDQSQQPVDLTDVEFSGYDKSFLGEQTITVTYQEKTTTFTVTVYYTATYKPGEGTSEKGEYVEYIENPDNYELVAFEKTGFVAPTGKQFKEWSQGTTGKVAVSANGNLNFTAVYEDIPATDWTDEQKAAFGQKLEGAVPPFLGPEFAGISYNAQYGAFVIVVSGNLVNQIKAAFNGLTDWVENTQYSQFRKTTAHGIAIVQYRFTEGEQEDPGSTQVIIAWSQTSWLPAQEADFKSKLDNFVPPYYSVLSYMSWDDSIGAYKYAYLDPEKEDYNDFKAYFDYYFTAVEGEDGQYYYQTTNGKVYVELSSTEVTQGLATFCYMYYLADPIPTSLQLDTTDVKVSYYVGDEFDAAGLVVKVLDENGDVMYGGQDVAQYCEFEYDFSAVGAAVVTVKLEVSEGQYLTAEINVTVEEAPVVYDADAFAKDLLEMVAPICNNYDGKKNNKAALKTVWDTMSQRYSTLSNEEKAKVIAAAAKADGTDLEKAMAFYNYACKKYGLTKFIEGRQVKALVAEHETGNSILPIVVIVASSVAAITAIGVVIALKRRKALLAK